MTHSKNLFDMGGGIPQLVVTFIAILELAKENLVEITQTESLGKIYVRTSRAVRRVNESCRRLSLEERLSRN